MIILTNAPLDTTNRFLAGIACDAEGCSAQATRRFTAHGIVRRTGADFTLYAYTCPTHEQDTTADLYMRGNATAN
jgi:hypothetical protein